jgi:hypothetical protein
VENAFGILANRWQVLLRKILLHPETVADVVTTCVCLHNLIRMRYRTQLQQMADREDRNHNMQDGAWRQGRILPGLDIDTRGNLGPKAARQQREYLKEYYKFCSWVYPMAGQNDQLNYIYLSV